MRSIIGYSIFAFALGLTAQVVSPGLLFSLLHQSVTSLSLWTSHPKAQANGPDNVVDGASRHARVFPGNRPSFTPEGPSDIREFDAADLDDWLVSQDWLAPRSAARVAPAFPPGDVALEPWRSAVAPSARHIGKSPASAPSNSSQRYELIRQIQRELKRAGCYDGSVDGSWGRGSKGAMATLIGRVNATLPLTEPDGVLLMLVRSQPAGICLNQCPEGQGSGDRCTPDAIAARDEKPETEIARPATAVLAYTNSRAADTSTRRPSGEASRNRIPLTGRMSVGGPPREDQAEGFKTGENQDPNSTSVTYSEVGEQRKAPDVVRPKPNPNPRKVARSGRRHGPAREYRSVQFLFQHPLGM